MILQLRKSIQLKYVLPSLKRSADLDGETFFETDL